jgi:hypothetical protein
MPAGTGSPMVQVKGCAVGGVEVMFGAANTFSVTA